MDNLQKLQAANPHIQIHTIHEAAFRRYGSVIQEDTSAFCAAAETIPFPETGSKYVASTPELDEIPEAAQLRETHCGGLDEDGRLNADKVQAFYLAQGEMIEVYSDTLHFCPCEVTGSGFSCIVGLQRGTNLPIAPEQKVNKLWAANKWLLGHEANTGLIERGAFPGIYGENWKINPIR